MSNVLAHQAERQRLARVLGVDPGELEFLADAPVEDLVALRTTLSDRLLERSRHEFERAVALADKIPRGLAATLAQRAMGSVLGGRAAALLTADMAADLAGRLPAEFLADVATHVDLRHVGPLIGGIPTDTMGAAGKVLRGREEWIVLSAFVGHVPADKLAVLLELFDAEALLRAGFVIEDTSRLDSAIALLPDARLDDLFATAHTLELWPEAMSLACHIGPGQAQRIVAAIDGQPDKYVDAMLASAAEHDLWAEAITVASQLGEDGAGVGGILRAIGRLPSAQLDSLLAAAHRDGLWREVLLVCAKATEDAAAVTLLDAVGRLAPEHLDALLEAADAAALWPELVELAVGVAGQDGTPVFDAINRLDDTRQDRLATVLNADPALRVAAAPLLERAPDHLRAMVVG